MKKKYVLLNIIIYSSLCLLITVFTYLVNLWLLSSSRHLSNRFSPTGAFFIEGLILMALGLLLLLGSGGINFWSLKAALLSAKAEALYDEDTPSPQETFRRDRWRPKGFTRAALVLMITGVLMILIYFATL